MQNSPNKMGQELLNSKFTRIRIVDGIRRTYHAIIALVCVIFGIIFTAVALFIIIHFITNGGFLT